MADETLSFAIVFEEASKLVNGVKEAGQALEGLKSSAATAAAGIDDAAKAAISGADAFQGIGQAAENAKAALADISGAVDLEVDPAPLIETAAAAETAGQALGEFSSNVLEVSVTAEEGAAAMQALGFATAEEEEAARLGREAVDALNGVVSKTAATTEEAAGGTGKLAAAFGNLGTVAKAAVGSFVGFAALRAVEEVGDLIGRSFRTAAGEFIEAERAATALDAALQSTGKFSSQATSAVRQFADEIARTTTFTDDAVISAAALIAQVGQLGGPKLVQATQAAVELSAVLGRDLQQSALLLARGAAGATEAFSRFGIVVKGAGTDAEKFDQILAQISSKFSGRAAADARTFGGSIEQLKNSWKEFLETVGQSLVVFQPVLNTLTAALIKANKILGVESVSSSLDARAALKGVGAEFQNVTETIERSNLRKLLAQAAEGSKVDDVIAAAVENGVKRAEEAAAKAEIAIKATVEGGSLDEIADVETDIARLRREAQETGNEELRAIVQNLEFTLAAAKQAKDFKIKLEGVGTTLQALEQISELVGNLQQLGGATPVQILDAKAATKSAADFSAAAEQIEAGATAIIESVEKVASAGGKVSGEELVQGFDALEKARASILEKFGKLAPEIDAAIKDAQSRLQDKARELDVRIELNLVGGFGQQSLDALVASFGQAEAEIAAFRQFVDAANSAAGADQLTLIQTTELFAQAKSLADVVPIVETAMQRLRAAVALGAVVGGPSAAEGVGALFTAAQQGSKALEETFGSLSAEAQAAFGGIFEALKTLAVAYPALQGPTQEFADQTNAVATGIATSFGQALGAVIGQAQDFSSVIRQIFGELVKEVLKQLAKIQGFKFLAGPLGGFLGGILGAIFKAEDFQIERPVVPPPEVPPPIIPGPVVPKLDPLEVPVEVAPAVAPKVPDFAPVLIPLAFGELPPLPEVDSVLVPVGFDLAELPDLAVPVAFAVQELPELTLPELTIGLAFEEPELPRLPEIQAPQLAAVPASLEFARRLELPDAVPASLEFARLADDRAVRELIRSRREPLRVLEGQRAEPATQITINATDGISVRRQLTAGALRREVERNFRRGF